MPTESAEEPYLFVELRDVRLGALLDRHAEGVWRAVMEASIVGARDSVSCCAAVSFVALLSCLLGRRRATVGLAGSVIAK
jgi:hypothetical protein